MLGIFKLANMMTKQLSPITIQKETCTRLLSTKSECNACVAHCPSNSISLKEDEVVLEECMECGICTTVCPTGTLTWRKPSPKQLVSQAKNTKGKGYIYCAHSSFPAKKASGIEVPCLGAISWEVWLGMLAENPNLALYLPKDACTKCVVSTGEKVWKEQLQLVEDLVGKTVERVDAVEKRKTDTIEDHSRRDFFRSMFQEAKSTNVVAVQEILGTKKLTTYKDELSQGEKAPIENVLDDINDFTGHLAEKVTNVSSYGYAEKRRILLDVLDENESVRTELRLPLPVIHNDCDVCGACVMLCPTKALVKHEDKIVLSKAKCVQCNLCQEVCWDKYVTLEQQHLN